MCDFSCNEGSKGFLKPGSSIAHVFGNQTAPVTECGLYMQGMDVVRYFGRSHPFQARTGLVHVSHFMSRAPDSGSFEFIYIQYFVQRTYMIGCPVTGGVHI